MTVRHFCRMFLPPANQPDAHQATTNPEGSAKTAHDGAYQDYRRPPADRQSLDGDQTGITMIQELRRSSCQSA